MHQPPVRIIGNIKGLSVLNPTAQEKFSNLVEDPEFVAIKRRVRERAVSQLTDDPKLIEEAQFVSSHSFDRYDVPEEIIEKLGILFGLRFPHARLQRQEPGVMTTMHLDDLNIGYMNPYEPSLPRFPFTPGDHYLFEKDPRSVVRFLIPLTDGLPGQGFVFQDTPIVNWKAGDVIHWDWVDTPHATFNTSFWPRDLIRLTGFSSEHTKRIIEAGFVSLDLESGQGEVIEDVQHSLHVEK